MKTINKLCLILLLIGYLTGCNESNNQLEKIEDYPTVVYEELGKDIYLYFSYEQAEVYMDKENDLIEYRIFYPSNKENYLIRIKKTTQYEDITTDLNIEWKSQDETTLGILNGVQGEGTIKLKYLENKEDTFKGEMWYDIDDQMMYLILSIGEYSLDLDAKVIFNPGYFVEVDLNSYEEADKFLNNYGIENNFFYRQKKNGSIQIAREKDDLISVFQGDEKNYISKNFYSNGYINEWTKETDPETGNFIETHHFIEENHTYSKVEYTKDLLCIYSYGKEFNTNTVSESKYDLNGMLTYEFYEDGKELKEINYTQTGGTMKYVNKKDDDTMNVTFKKINHNGVERRHYLTIDCKYYSKKFTYVSEDSPILTRYENTHYTYNEHVVWTFNGKGNNFENMITCVRTYDGKTVTYTFDTVPWGTGMLYPPRDPHEFYF